MATTAPRITNADLALMFGEMKGQMQSVLQMQTEINKAINGNGKPGLIADQRNLQETVRVVEGKIDKHLKDHKDEKEAEGAKKEKWSGRTWAVVMVFVTQFVGLAFLFVRTGGLK